MHLVEPFKLEIDDVDDDDELGEWVDEALADALDEPDEMVKSIEDAHELACDLGWINSVSSFFLAWWLFAACCADDDDVAASEGDTKFTALLEVPFWFVFVCDNNLEIIFFTFVCSAVFTVGISMSLLFNLLMLLVVVVRVSRRFPVRRTGIWELE